MTDNAERWRNVAEAAQWLAEGREVEWRPSPQHLWRPMENPPGLFLSAGDEYRLKPEPPKPREFRIGWNFISGRWEVMSGPAPVFGNPNALAPIRVIEAIE